jgi:hypothetical protein
MGHGVLFHLGCLWTLTFGGVCGGVFMYGGFIFRFAVICSNFVSRSTMFISVLWWCIHNILIANGSLRGSLLSSGGMVGSLYVMVFAEKYMLTCVSSNLVLYGVLFVVHSSSSMVSIVIVFWFSCAASRIQCMAWCVFLVLCGWAYPIFCHLCE